MNNKHKIIISLILIGVIVFSTVQLIVVPRLEREREEYAKNQLSPALHSLESILNYQNKYMGNASNLSNLFNTLPLSNIDMSFQLYPDTFRADVYYKEATGSIDSDLLKGSLIYNATAAFALIDNLQTIDFIFTGDNYSIDRKSVQEWYKSAASLSDLLTEEEWTSTVQKNLNDNEYLNKLFADFIGD